MQNFMATGNQLWLVPGGGTFIGNMLSNGGAEYTMFDLNNPSDLSDSDKSVLSTETTYELGYSGKIGNKLSFSVDVYNIRKQNVLGTKRITPQLSLNPTTFANEFASTFGNTLAATYASLGLPAAAYSSILNTITTVAAGAAAQTAATIQQGWGFVLADQNPGIDNGIFSPFFGIPALTTTLPSKLAQKTHAPVFTLVAKRCENGFKIISEMVKEKI